MLFIYSTLFYEQDLSDMSINDEFVNDGFTGYNCVSSPTISMSPDLVQCSTRRSESRSCKSSLSSSICRTLNEVSNFKINSSSLIILKAAVVSSLLGDSISALRYYEEVLFLAEFLLVTDLKFRYLAEHALIETGLCEQQSLQSCQKTYLILVSL